MRTNNSNAIDITSLSVSDEPFSDGRAQQVTKYHDFFTGVAKNKRIVCPTGKACCLAHSYRKWLAKQGHVNAIVRSRERCEDGSGGVWWLGEEAKKATSAKSVWRHLDKAA